MKEPKRRQSLSGAVLIMVMTVMIVLIIMLMATLTVVTTANQRIFTKYEENQAYYTARSALDVFTQNILNDSKYYAYDDSGARRQYQYTLDAATGTVSPLTDIKQGFAMELELYKLHALNDAGAASNITLNDYKNGSNDPEAKNYSVSNNGLYSIEYTVVMPTISDGSNDYGKFVDTNSANTEQLVNITVEVEQRFYNFGGANGAAFDAIAQFDPETQKETKHSHTGDNCLYEKIQSDGGPNAIFQAIYNSTSGVDVKIVDKNDSSNVIVEGKFKKEDLLTSIREGNRAKDLIRLKVTAKSTFMGVEGSAVVYYDTREGVKTNSSQAVTSMSGVSGDSGTIIIGGGSALSSFDIEENSTVTGNLYIHGSLGFASPRSVYFLKDTVYTIRGDLTLTDQVPNERLKFEEAGSVIYVDGTMTFSNAGSFSSAGKTANVVAKNITFANNANGATYYTKMFCENFVPMNNSSAPTFMDTVYTNDVTLVDSSGNLMTGILPSDAIDWVNGNINLEGFMNTWGQNLSICSNGGFYLPVDPGIGPAGAIEYFKYTGPDTLTGQTNGTILTVNNGPTNTFATPIQTGYENPSAYTMTADFKKEFDLHQNLAGQGGETTFKLDTERSLYNKILDEDVNTFVDETPDAGKNGDIDPNLPEYPNISVFLSEAEINAQLANVPEQWLNWEGDKRPAANPANIGNIALGVINDSNCTDYGYQGPWDENYKIDKKYADEAKKLALATVQTEYDQAMEDFLNSYIRGAEKANVSDSSLLVSECQNEVQVKSVSDYENDEKFKGYKDQLAALGITSISGVIDGNGYLKNGNVYGPSNGKVPSNPVVIYAENDITLQLGQPSDTSAVMGYFVVVGDGNVKLLMPDGKDTYNLGQTASGQGFNITTLDILKAMKSSEIRLGSSSNPTPTPRVYMYAGDAVKNINIYSEDSFIAAHMYFPFADVYYNVNNGFQFSNTFYNDKKLDMGGGFWAVGSLICKSYTTSNNNGVAYISNDDDPITPGDPIFNWNIYRYARN